MDIDLEELAAMVEMLKEAEFSEFRYEKGDLCIVFRRGAGADIDDHEVIASRAQAVSSASAAPVTSNSSSPPISPTSRPAPSHSARSGAAQEAMPVEPAGAGELVVAPLLGTFYRRPKPGEAPFVSIGDLVEADTVVCIVEVMKLMNSVVAGMRGVVVAIHANDGDLVEFGQPLVRLAPVLD